MTDNNACSLTNLGQLALSNPRLAVLLLRGDRVLPRSYNYVLRWDTGAAESPQDAPAGESMYNDAIVTEFRYRAEAPSLAHGSLFRPMIVDYFEKNVGAFIHVDIRSSGPDKDQFTEGPTPLGNIATFGDSEPKFITGRNWVFPKDARLHIRGTNSRALAEDEVPLIVRLTFNVLEYSGTCLKSISYADAIHELEKKGLR